jgi:predicted NACHT family NTPase
MAKEKSEQPILVNGIKFEFTGNWLKEHFERRVKELTEYINTKKDILHPDTVRQKQVKLAQYILYAEHVNPHYSYHLDNTDLFTFEITENDEHYYAGDAGKSKIIPVKLAN